MPRLVPLSRAREVCYALMGPSSLQYNSKTPADGPAAAQDYLCITAERCRSLHGNGSSARNPQLTVTINSLSCSHFSVGANAPSQTREEQGTEGPNEY